MIPNREVWHYLPVKKNYQHLLRRMTAMVIFFCLTCLHSFRTKNKLDSHKEVCEKIYFSKIVIPSEDTKTLEFNQYQNLIKHHLLFIQILNV